MATSNRITKVAVVGAGGNSGTPMVDALLKTGKHTVSALTRAGSKSKVPEGVIIKEVDYNKPETLVEALKGQDALVITLGGFAPKETQSQLVNAAAEANVQWILPNEWSPDTAHEGINKDVSVFQHKADFRKSILDIGKSSFIAVSTGFWYEWSLAIAPAYGFDIANRAVTFFDDGETKISTSTWPQVGRTVAGILSLPIKPEGGNDEACLEHLKNKVVYTRSFTVSQKDMFASLLRVTGTNEDDWTITKEPAHERYANGLKELGEGSRVGFVKMMYTRIFYPDGCGDLERKGTVNSLLGLPEEDIDEATKVAVERSNAPAWTG